MQKSRAEGREEGRAEGFEKGEERAKEVMVRNAVKMGLSIDAIVQSHCPHRSPVLGLPAAPHTGLFSPAENPSVSK